MSFAEFQQSVSRDSTPPSAASRALQGLWHDARGDWERAHTCAQDDKSRDGSWVHAYLPRKEGYVGNAGYWYAGGGKRTPDATVTLDAEWAAIAAELLRESERAGENR